MKGATAIAAVCLLLLCTSPVLANDAQVKDEHPIAKVISMLEGLIAKSEMEGKAEAVSYTKFEYWCRNSVKSLEDAIAAEKEQIDALESKIDGLTKEEASLTKQIAELESQIGELEQKGTEAETDRKEGREAYEAAEADFKSTIEAIASAITALSDAKTTTEAELLQAKSKVKKSLTFLVSAVSAEQLAALQSFLSDVSAAPAPAGPPRPDLMAAGDMSAHIDKYSFKSDNVIELLKELKMKFEDELLEATKEETNAQNSYDLSKQARDAAIKAAKESKEEKEKTLGDVQGDLAQAKSDLESTQEDLAADSGTLESTQKTCALKASEWKERSDIRAQEIEAMKEAIKILAEVGGVSTEPPTNPVPPPSPVEAEASASFLQIVDPKMKAVNLLRQKARVTHSRALERLAQEIAAHLSGPFDEVNQMIQKMIFRLMAEQKDEDDHKNWCDEELSKTNTSKVDKEDKIAELDEKIEANKATVQKLVEDIKEANEMIEAIVAHKKEATEIREIGKKENALAIKDAEDAQTAISNAIAVLEEFYKESGAIPKESWEFVQRDPVSLPETPATWDSGYTGVTDPMNQPSGIITVMKTCSEDFAKMEADTKAQEVTDQKAYDEDMQQCDIEQARRTTEVEMKTAEKKRLVDKIDSLMRQKKQTSDELDAVNQYIKDLQPACVEGDSSYEDRKAARATEIAALQEAQLILADAFKEVPGPAPAAASFLQRRRVA